MLKEPTCGLSALHEDHVGPRAAPAPTCGLDDGDDDDDDDDDADGDDDDGDDDGDDGGGYGDDAIC